jgi:opacity protein-like surface antigen
MNVNVGRIIHQFDLKSACLGTGDPDLSNQAGTTKYETEFSSHNITLGLRYSF